MTGNPGLDKIIFGINGLVVIAASALVVYSHTMVKTPPTDESAEFSSMVANSMVEFQKPQVQFPEMVVNLYSREARLRFINLKMNIETFEQEQIEQIENSKSLIQDALIDIASNMRPEEVNSVTGRILLETRIKNKVNSKLSKPAVKKIYFSKFIVQ
ncbi:MAG: flagellar basal body-associated FliL family protein [Bacteriovoracaceae bacterium]|nr:flagellar basal body-associated FliL family protein [Bacteriovoracaceae bacterium]